LGSDFPCTGCGLCCQIAGFIVTAARESQDPIDNLLGDTFTYKWDSNGVCENLKDNRCSVYKNRPLICDVKSSSLIKKMNLPEAYKLNSQICNFLIQKAGLDDSFLIKDFD
jgi:Fe-S-cluster containining protein